MSSNIKDVISIDFHVHTPASKCYDRRNMTEEETYKDLLFKIFNSKLNIVCITDHNTIKGYKKIMTMYKEILNQLEVYYKIKTINGEIPVQLIQEVDELERLKQVFDQVKFYPGVEFTTQDQIHMLIVFNDKIEIERIEQFIYSGGYESNNQGNDDNEVLSNWTVINLLEEVSKNFDKNAIVVAAHVDRKKGIWESLDGSTYKSNIFRSPKLAAITYCTHSTKDAIKNVMNNKEYKRVGIPELAFFQCSDFHNKDDESIGTPRAYFRMNDLEFESLNKTFTNPNEYISSPAPFEAMKVVKELISNSNNINYIDLSTDEQLDYICKSVCALGNLSFGSIIIGVNKNNEPVGIEISKDKIDLVIEHIKKSIIPNLNIDYEAYEFGRRLIISIRINRGHSNLYWYKEKSYFKLGKEINEAHPKDILEHVENEMVNKYNDILSLNKVRLQKITDMIATYSDGIEIMKYMNHFDKETVLIGNILDFKVVGWKGTRPKLKFYNFSNSGNTIALQKSSPRSRNAVFRFTAPIDYISDELIEKIELQKFSGEKVILAEDGIVHYDSRDDIYILPESKACLLLSIKDEYLDKVSLKFITAYLKSNALLYYAYICKDTFNLHLPSVFKSLKIPQNISRESLKIIDALVDKIIEVEDNFVSEFAKKCIECTGNDKNGSCISQKQNKSICDEACINHNNNIIKIMQEIDKEIYSILKFDQNTINHIEKVLAKAYAQELG